MTNLFKQDPVYPPIPPKITICNPNRCRGNHTNPILVNLCGSEKEGFFALHKRREIHLPMGDVLLGDCNNGFMSAGI